MMQVIPSGRDISALEELTGAGTGLIHPIPAKELAKFDFLTRRLFLHKWALYTFPTTELIDYLADRIAGKSAIEIGAGLGVIGRALGVPLTDNKMQEWPEIRATYQLMGQPTIKYPPDVIELDAISAVERYKPDIVIGSYITHKWDDSSQSGNWWGVDTLKLTEMVPEYLMIGNLNTHRNDPAMKQLDHVERHDFLFTRGEDNTSAIFCWKQ
jgi:hypothetical protein